MTKSQQMARVRSKDTYPEKIVRGLLSRMGVRYRLHRRDIPGRPDLFIGRLKLAVFVNGCFWHGHQCRRSIRPKSNRDFWNEKLDRNIERDERVRSELSAKGLSSTIFWTCERDHFAARCRRLAKKYHSMAAR